MRGDARSPKPVLALGLLAAGPQGAVPVFVALALISGSPATPGSPLAPGSSDAVAFPQAEAGSRSAATPRPIADREAIPGRLRVRVFHTEARPGAPGPAWTYATDGFRAVAQKEMILVVLRQPAEDVSAFPEDPIQFFVSVYPLAARGQVVLEGSHTSFGGSSFLGREDIRGLTYTRPDPFRSALLQPDALVLVPLTGPELDAVQRFGALRVLGLLGHQARTFPWPSFFDRGRASVVPAHADWSSVLEKSRVISLPGVRVVAEFPTSMSSLVGQGNLLVSLPLASRAAIEEAVRQEGVAVALSAELDPQADALAIYPPGKKLASAIRQGDEPLSRMAGTFVTFLPSTEGDVGKILEDGFAVQLSEASRKALHESLRTGHDLELLGAPGSMAIRVRWRD